MCVCVGGRVWMSVCVVLRDRACACLLRLSTRLVNRRRPKTWEIPVLHLIVSRRNSTPRNFNNIVNIWESEGHVSGVDIWQKIILLCKLFLHTFVKNFRIWAESKMLWERYLFTRSLLRFFVQPWVAIKLWQKHYQPKNAIDQDD